MLGQLANYLRRRHMKVLKPFANSVAEGLRLSLGDCDSEKAAALANAFAGAEEVEVVEGNLLDLTCDAIVSPANSFGDMGGGIDKAIDDFHQGAAQRAVMAAIAAEYFGELPVGAALIVKLPAKRFPYIIAAPTMRIPGSVIGSINAYLAMRAALTAVLRHNANASQPIRTIAIPGLCTGVGGMPCDVASQQMRTAFDNILRGGWQKVYHLAQAPYALKFERL